MSEIIIRDNVMRVTASKKDNKYYLTCEVPNVCMNYNIEFSSLTGKDGLYGVLSGLVLAGRLKMGIADIADMNGLFYALNKCDTKFNKFFLALKHSDIEKIIRVKATSYTNVCMKLEFASNLSKLPVIVFLSLGTKGVISKPRGVDSTIGTEVFNRLINLGGQYNQTEIFFNLLEKNLS